MICVQFGKDEKTREKVTFYFGQTILDKKSAKSCHNNTNISLGKVFIRVHFANINNIQMQCFQKVMNFN